MNATDVIVHGDSTGTMWVEFKDEFKNLEAMATQILAKKAQIKQLEDEVATMSDKIKEYMAKEDTAKLEIGDRRCWITTVTSNKFDKDKFSEEHPRLYKKYTYPQESSRFYVK